MQEEVNKEVGDKIFEIVNNMETRAKSLGCDMRKGQPTPGNIEGGLSSIEEKSLGAIMKSGTKPIQGVLEYTERVTNQKVFGSRILPVVSLKSLQVWQQQALSV